MIKVPSLRRPKLLQFDSCLALVVICSGWLAPVYAESPTVQGSDAGISYTRQIEPIFRAHCQGCHQPAKAQGAFIMTDFAHLKDAGESGEKAIVPGKPDESYLVAQISSVNGVAAMPQKASPLSPADVALIRQWIAEGAVDDSTASAAIISAERPPIYSRAPLITAIAYSPDGKWLAVSGLQEVLLLDVATRRTQRRLVGQSERIESISFSPDSQRLAVTGGSPGRLGEVQVWEVNTGKLSLSKFVTFDTIYGGCFSPDGKLIAFGCTDNTVRAIDAETGEQKLRQGAHNDWLAACVFSPDGKYLVSAGRDMTVKLTEVETERFIDNITSITPGALRGGISALAMHPERSETLVGGADGTPKAYRLIRETARRIGDDANLIRSFPAMPGRIFSLSMGPQGKHFAAASTLDGNSQVVVYPYDFDGSLPDDVKAAMAKRVAERNDKENQLIHGYTSNTSEATSKLDIPGNTVYAIDFSSDGSRLAIGGSDGRVRIMEVQTGRIETEFSPVLLEKPADSISMQAELRAGTGRPLDPTTHPNLEEEAKLLPSAELVDLRVEPASIELESARSYCQLVVTGVFANGQTADVTRQAHYGSCPQAKISNTGLVRPQAEGNGELSVEFKGLSKRLPIRVGDLKQTTQADFIRDVNPLLSRLGCNSGTCHGAQKGKNGFKLSLRGYDPLEDVRALSDDLRSRRLNAAAPDASLMLLKPVGAVPHEGGVLLTTDSVHFATLRDWIGAGAKLNTSSQKVARIEVSPTKPVIESEQSWQQFRVEAHYADGTSRDVTHETFIESGNGEVCKSFEGGRVQALRRGEAPILARYEGAYAAATVTVMGDRKGFVWSAPPAVNTIDTLVADKWKRLKIAPSQLCNDAEFIRRVRLDLTGLPPTTEELKAFLADRHPSKVKRREKIDELLGSTDYVEHWTNKWADLLQVNSKFIGREGAKEFRDWIRAAVAENRPYDQFATDLLTASGSNKANPAASYFKILREPNLIMENTTHLFLAIRFNCNKCHDHPFERWTQDQYYQLSAFFAQTALKADPAAGDQKIGGTAVEGAKPLYEEVIDKPTGEMNHVRTGNPVAPQFPYDCSYSVREGASRREQLAAWITSKDNPYFAKSLVNRLWGYLTGHGLIMPLDDIRAGNPPTNPELLEHLTNEFVSSNFDIEHVLRLICNSRTYQLSVATNQWNQDDVLNYSHATARRLRAEVLYDAVYRVTGAVSDIPGAAPGTRAAALPDVAVQLADGFLNTLGRPVRESACECERSEELRLGSVMALISGPTVGKAISDPKGALSNLAKRLDLSEEALIREIYLRVLNREATATEVVAIIESADGIALDHAALTKAQAEREAWWAAERQQKEAIRLAKLEKTKAAIAKRELAIAPQRKRLEEERQAEISVADMALSEYQTKTLGVANQFLKDNRSANWFPLLPQSVSASNKADLVVQADRSIVASGNAERGSYQIVCRTPLTGIRGVRLEALGLPGIAGGGPGLSSNGNFVVTEVELEVAPLNKPKGANRVAFESGKADFSQDGLGPEQAIDGEANGQRGWAVSPRGGTVHWATFQAKESFGFEGGSLITFTIHQNHNAEAYRLAHFRLSVTTDCGDLPLGLPEEFASYQSLPAEKRTNESLARLVSYLDANDPKAVKLRNALADANKPLADDAELVQLQRLYESLEKETPDDPKLVQLRSDVAASTEQVENRRLTLAQDLTWALINSPAFLFNH